MSYQLTYFCLSIVSFIAMGKDEMVDYDLVTSDEKYLNIKL